MKKILSFTLFLISGFTLARGMEKAPSTPVKKQKNARVELLESLHEAVTGISHENKFSEDMIAPSLLDASPQSFIKTIKQDVQREIEQRLTAKGVTSEAVNRLAPEIYKDLQALGEQNKAYSPVKSPLKQEIEEIMKEHPSLNLSFRSTQTENIAYVAGDVVVIDAQRFQAIAPSPQSRAMILNHELRHKINNDCAIRMAAERALKEQNKELSPESKNLLTRSQEMIADLEAISGSHVKAAAGVRVAARVLQAYGPGVPAEHPSHLARFKYSKAMALILREHEKQKNDENAQPVTLPNSDRIQVKSPIKESNPRKRLAFDVDAVVDINTNKPAKRLSPEKPTES